MKNKNINKRVIVISKIILVIFIKAGVLAPAFFLTLLFIIHIID